jgi:hypothetical protein
LLHSPLFLNRKKVFVWFNCVLRMSNDHDHITDPVTIVSISLSVDGPIVSNHFGSAGMDFLIEPYIYTCQEFLGYRGTLKIFVPSRHKWQVTYHCKSKFHVLVQPARLRFCLYSQHFSVFFHQLKKLVFSHKGGEIGVSLTRDSEIIYTQTYWRFCFLRASSVKGDMV